MSYFIAFAFQFQSNYVVFTTRFLTFLYIMLVELTKSAALLVIAGISKDIICCFFSSARV